MIYDNKKKYVISRVCDASPCNYLTAEVIATMPNEVAPLTDLDCYPLELLYTWLPPLRRAESRT